MIYKKGITLDDYLYKLMADKNIELYLKVSGIITSFKIIDTPDMDWLVVPDNRDHWIFTPQWCQSESSEYGVKYLLIKPNQEMVDTLDNPDTFTTEWLRDQLRRVGFEQEE